MIRLRSHAGPEKEFMVGGNRQAALVTPDKMLTFNSGAGDYWVGMVGQDAMLNSRFREVSAGGGQSPCTFSALGQIIEAGISGGTQYLLPHSHCFSVSRFDDETGLRLTARLSENLLALSLCDTHGNQEEAGTTINFEIPLAECPESVQGGLWSLPYAMLNDHEQTLGKEGIRPLREPAERMKHSWWDRPHWRYRYELVGA